MWAWLVMRHLRVGLVYLRADLFLSESRLAVGLFWFRYLRASFFI